MIVLNVIFKYRVVGVWGSGSQGDGALGCWLKRRVLETHHHLVATAGPLGNALNLMPIYNTQPLTCRASSVPVLSLEKWVGCSSKTFTNNLKIELFDVVTLRKGKRLKGKKKSLESKKKMSKLVVIWYKRKMFNSAVNSAKINLLNYGNLYIPQYYK